MPRGLGCRDLPYASVQSVQTMLRCGPPDRTSPSPRCMALPNGRGLRQRKLVRCGDAFCLPKPKLAETSAKQVAKGNRLKSTA
jgi:hypothetical protein